MNKENSSVKAIKLSEVTSEEYGFIMTAYKLMTMMECSEISDDVYDFVISQLKEEMSKAE